MTIYDISVKQCLLSCLELQPMTNYLPLVSVSVAHEGLRFVMVCGELFPVLYCWSYPHASRFTFHFQYLSGFYPFSCINLGFISSLAVFLGLLVSSSVSPVSHLFLCLLSGPTVSLLFCPWLLPFALCYFHSGVWILDLGHHYNKKQLFILSPSWVAWRKTTTHLTIIHMQLVVIRFLIKLAEQSIRTFGLLLTISQTTHVHNVNYSRKATASSHPDMFL